MRRYIILTILVLSSFSVRSHEWTKTARIADVEFWPDFTEEEIKEGIDQAHQQGLSAVIAWLTSENIDIPQGDLDALTKAVSYAHETYPEMKFIVYTAPLEIITPNADRDRDGELDEGKKSLSTKHPEWLQVGLDGQKAIFYGDFEFWIGKYDEDVWCCPNDPIYREKVKKSFRRMAETGIDGIWIDVTLFLCNYGDWDDNWACHCEDCQKKFHEDTGFPIPRRATWDTLWKTWVLWRQQCIEEFIKELSHTAKEINPETKIIVEHWHGFDAEATENAWSPIGLRTVTDVLAHEYVSASEYPETHTPVNYLRDVTLYTFYRGVDTDHPSWILSYSQRKDGQRMLAASVLGAGCNFYDTVYPDMADSVSLKERTRIFQWLKGYSHYYYDLTPVSSVAVYYSKATVDFYDCPREDWEFYREFVGVSMMLLSLQIPYTVVTDLESLTTYDLLILPNVACLSDDEEDLLQEFFNNGGYLVSTGRTGYYNEWGQKRNSDLKVNSEKYCVTTRFFGNEYYNEVNPFFWPDEIEEQGTGESIRKEFSLFLNQIPLKKIITTASDKVIIFPFILENNLVFRVINLDGISPGDATPDPQTISLTTERKVLNALVIPFLSSPEYLEAEGTTVTVEIQEHALVIVESEPVSIFSNEHDLPAAEDLAAYLKANGIPVSFVASPDKASSVMIVFGGHKAKDTGEFVTTILTDDQKAQLEQPGYSEMFTFENDTLIIVIAGNEREDTAALAQKIRREVVEFL